MPSWEEAKSTQVWPPKLPFSFSILEINEDCHNIIHYCFKNTVRIYQGLSLSELELDKIHI